MREMQGYLDITEGVFSKTTWERPGKVKFLPYYQRCKASAGFHRIKQYQKTKCSDKGGYQPAPFVVPIVLGLVFLLAVRLWGSRVANLTDQSRSYKSFSSPCNSFFTASLTSVGNSFQRPDLHLIYSYCEKKQETHSEQRVLDCSEWQGCCNLVELAVCLPSKGCALQSLEPEASSVHLAF